MTWTQNLTNDSEIEGFFVAMSCRLGFNFSDFTLYYDGPSERVYYVSFSEDNVEQVIYGFGTLYTETTDKDNMDPGQYVYDSAAGRLYFCIAETINGVYDADTLPGLAVKFKLYYADRDVLWHSTPTSSATALVNWKGILRRAPSYKITFPQIGLGFFPTEPTSMEFINDHSFNRYLYRGSFYRETVSCWHQLGGLDTDNIVKRYQGIVGRSVIANEDSVTFECLDKSEAFEKKVSGNAFTGSACDPRFNGLYALTALGTLMSGDDNPIYQMCNLDYNTDSPSTSNNRKFAIYDASSTSTYAETSVAGTMRPGGADRFNVTTLEDEFLFRVGDYVWFDGAADQYLIVDSTNGSGGILFTTTTSGGSNQAGNLRKVPLKAVYLVKDGTTPYQLRYGRDFTWAVHDSAFLGITLTSTVEANVGAATFNPDTDSIWCEPSGKTGALTFEGNPIDYNLDANYNKNIFRDGVLTLFQFLKEIAGLTDAEIDWTELEDIRSFVTADCYLPLPYSPSEDMPTIREALDLLLRSLTIRAFFDPDGVLRFRAIRAAQAADATIEKEELLSYEYEIDYSNVATIQCYPIWDAIVARRIRYVGTKAQILAGTARLAIVEGIGFSYGTGENNSTWANQYLYNAAGKTSKLEVALVNKATSQNQFSRIQDYLGSRFGIMKVRTKRFGLDRDPGDTVQVKRDSIPGLDDAEGNSQNFVINDIEKGQDTVSIEFSDNFGPDFSAEKTHWQ